MSMLVLVSLHSQVKAGKEKVCIRDKAQRVFLRCSVIVMANELY